MYAMHDTKLNIMFAVDKLSRYAHNPNVDHRKGIIRILGYLKRAKSLRLFYNKFPLILERYSDASWNTSITNNKLSSRWIFTLRGGAISCASKKQICITDFIMEFEFITLAIVGKEANWLRNLLLVIRVVATTDAN